MEQRIEEESELQNRVFKMELEKETAEKTERLKLESVQELEAIKARYEASAGELEIAAFKAVLKSLEA